MTEKNAKPQLRFAGFDDTWEQRELWELTIWDKKFNEVEAEKQPKIVKYPYVLADVFSKIEDASGDVRLLSTGNYIGYTTDEKAGKNLCVGEVVAIPWGGVPNIKYYKGKFVTADNRIATSNDTETLGNRFLSLYLEHSLAFLQSIYRGASIKHPSMNDVLSMQISIPHIQEQREIETWFANLDNLITLHQRKYDKLTNVKKSMLEKMFPKNGSNVPEIRFKGFSDAWEQRKFEDIAVRSSSISSESGLPRVEYEDIISGTGRLNKDIFAKESDKTGIVFHKGDVLYGKLRPYLQNWLLPSFNGLAVGDFWVLQPQNADSSFLYRLIQSRQFDEVANQSTGTKMPRSDWKLVSKTEFFIPSAIGEQAAIGAYFEQLDNLITLHQRELEKLKNLKKACLEKMFV